MPATQNTQINIGTEIAYIGDESGTSCCGIVTGIAGDTIEINWIGAHRNTVSRDEIRGKRWHIGPGAIKKCRTQ